MTEDRREIKVRITRGQAEGYIQRGEYDDEVILSEEFIAAIVGTLHCGGILWLGSDGHYSVLPADLGGGYNVLRSRGVCQSPDWLDLVDLITEIIEAPPGVIPVDMGTIPVPIPTIVMAYAESLGEGGKPTPSAVIVAPSVGIVVYTGYTAGEKPTPSVSVPIPTAEASAEIV